jgi:hypothetical protein
MNYFTKAKQWDIDVRYISTTKDPKLYDDKELKSYVIKDFNTKEDDSVRKKWYCGKCALEFDDDEVLGLAKKCPVCGNYCERTDEFANDKDTPEYDFYCSGCHNVLNEDELLPKVGSYGGDRCPVCHCPITDDCRMAG